MAKVIRSFEDTQDNDKIYLRTSEYNGPREKELQEKGFLAKPKQEPKKKAKQKPVNHENKEIKAKPKGE